MSKESLEHLSSLMDGEINKDTGRFLIRRLGADQELRAAWARYHLVRECLRHHEGKVSGTGFSARVQQALDREDAITSRSAFASRWLKPAAGVAIAASVALMAIVTVGPGPQSVNDPAAESLAESPLDSFVSPNSQLSPSPISQQASTAGLTSNRQKMNSYLLRHYQVAGSTGGKGLITFVPIVVTRTAERAGDEEQSRPTDNDLQNGTDNARQ